MSLPLSSRYFNPQRKIDRLQRVARSPTVETSALVRFVRRHPRLFVLTGAGASTESGIPGYRDADGRWTRTPPVRVDEFLRTEEGRRRYWLRSMLGWPQLAGARPNAAHAALAQLEALGRVAQLVTQNVDGLHQRAGSRGVIELHGNAHSATCVVCGAVHLRAAIQHTLERENDRFLHIGDAVSAADCDVNPQGDPEAHALEDFVPPACEACNGILKPDVVFFGECVPRDRVEAARAALERADAMLVVGSSLMVYSGYRFCEWAMRMGKPLAAVNRGRTRADPLLVLKVERACGGALMALVGHLAREDGEREAASDTRSGEVNANSLSEQPLPRTC